MSFLDNLENNLKALESLEAGGLDDRKRRESERDQALAAAPWAERLKASPYVAKLMRDLTREGFSRRMKVNFVWIDRTLRLESMEQRLELRPTAKGVDAVFPDRRVALDLDGEPDGLIREWMGILDEKRKEQQEAMVEEVAEEE